MEGNAAARYQVDFEDLKPEYQDIAEVIGLDKFMLMVAHFGGQQLYIPKHESLTRNERDEQILAEFDGYNFKELALKYRLTERHIRFIVAPVLKQVRARPMDGQVSIFDSLGSEIS